MTEFPLTLVPLPLIVPSLSAFRNPRPVEYAKAPDSGIEIVLTLLPFPSCLSALARSDVGVAPSCPLPPLVLERVLVLVLVLVPVPTLLTG